MSTFDWFVYYTRIEVLVNGGFVGVYLCNDICTIGGSDGRLISSTRNS